MNRNLLPVQEGGRRTATRVARQSHLEYDGLDFQEGWLTIKPSLRLTENKYVIFLQKPVLGCYKCL